MTPEEFAKNEYRDYVTYRELALIETVPAFKRILEELTQHELEDYNFWLSLSSKKTFRISPWELLFLKFLRRVLGLTFTAKFLERHEKQAIMNYHEVLLTASGKMKEEIQQIIRHEEYHERSLIDQIKEERITFMGSIVLGLNDALIELTGALTGFAFAFHTSRTVAVAGFILGIAASMSMASSAYLSARHEQGKDPAKAALYTGVSYLAVVLLLLLPFVVMPYAPAAVAVMIATVILIVAALSYYTAIVFERAFKKSLVEMLLFSVGVAIVSFIIGSLARRFTGLEAL
ncbi:MAG: VIT1/CCC1 transporter family protein [Candidatus Omnitrophica bacterium]|nr:VIT1/CCC1 transporter family protein [Candidatus Omnitrophota bacterium]